MTIWSGFLVLYTGQIFGQAYRSTGLLAVLLESVGSLLPVQDKEAKALALVVVIGGFIGALNGFVVYPVAIPGLVELGFDSVQAVTSFLVYFGWPQPFVSLFIVPNISNVASHVPIVDIVRVVGAFAASPRIYAIGMGRPVEEIGAAWLGAIANPIAPIVVSSPPCQDIIITGDDLRRPGGGLASLPVPISTPGFDAAPYLTATLCITKDPESGIQNIGTYRAALKKTDRLGVRMSARPGGAGGYLHWRKYNERRERMPCAIVIGAAPVIVYTGPQKLAIDQDEITVAGAPIRTARAITVDLEVPADAEIVIEGLIDPDVLEPEGPFGESNGYVALEDFNMSMQVTAITHRKSPVFASIISQVTPSESSVIKKVAYEPMFLDHLRNQLSLKGVLRVVMHEPLSNLRPILFLQFADDTPRTEIWRALQGASAKLADCGKFVIAVSQDIDPANTDAVMWSLAYRSNPIEDVHIEPYRSTGHAPKSGPQTMDSTMLVDATLKYPMPPLALPGREFMERAQTLWRELGLPAITLRPPRYGYSLGDWSETWELYACNAVAGEWQKNGANTLARRRGGLTPETPVRTIEAAATPAK